MGFRFLEIFRFRLISDLNISVLLPYMQILTANLTGI